MNSNAQEAIEKVFQEERKDKKIIIFGAGRDCRRFLEVYGESINSDARITDNNRELWGAVRYGLPVIPPETLKEEDCDSILLVIAMGAYFQIMPQIKRYGITQIFFFHDGAFIDPYATEIDDFSKVVLRLETTAFCNFSCTFCTHSDMKRLKGVMDDALFQRIVLEARDMGFTKLDIRNFGEPLLDKKLEDRIRFAKESGFQFVFLYTNAMLLNQSRYDSLAQAGLDNIIVSISPREEFEKTRQGVPYSAIINNLKEIHLKETTGVEIHLVAPGSSQAECQQAEQELKELGFRNIVKVHIHNWGIGDEEALPSRKTYIPCRRLWDSVTVFWDGRVTLCCLDYEGDEILGDLSSNCLADIVNSDQYQDMRKRQLNGTPPKICLSCSNFK